MQTAHIDFYIRKLPLLNAEDFEIYLAFFRYFFYIWGYFGITDVVYSSNRKDAS